MATQRTDAGAEPVPSRHNIAVAGHVRTFFVVDGGPAAPAPSAVLIFLHGSHQSGRSLRTFTGGSFDAMASGGHVAVVYPDGLRRRWNHAGSGVRVVDDVAFMVALSDHFRALHGPIPIVIAGYSNGGQLVIRLIHEVPEMFDGAAILSATLPLPGGLDFADRHQPFPVLLMHGTRDTVVPYRGETQWWGLLGGPRGPSAPETAQYFAERNGITVAPVHDALPHRRGGRWTRVERTRYDQDGHPPVLLYTVHGGGHVVPHPATRPLTVLGRNTRDISAADAVAEFFPVLRP
ncbi:alpha/beta hydrolase family esterase [Arthrobacter sp. ERGS1:01]|uniref:alpha/beta hydrolase family esterase n=1 Tax=Arthrobacter sp. ERGS1:01 TaxID=1704044 RepID=UPI0006B5E8CB|nr:hypothetical protein [Arthrobacter sp. ERGS1:01]